MNEAHLESIFGGMGLKWAAINNYDDMGQCPGKKSRVGASCKRHDALRAQYQEEPVKASDEGCLITERGLNQDTTLKCADGALLMLEDQLGVYVHHMLSSSDFSELQGIGMLAEKMVEKGMHTIFPYVYFLIILALVLPVATASMERVFSAMNIIKNPLHNKMGDQ
ncbi:hypothetical protein L3X38_037101 [Prunus dulcis]|uniref:HAT C-terminal dimerisation domain-containing protein n=1 Tax=Prunus dulcis TaxID=3755 RepID=A0AAD4YQC7_PRUDU|nr:hypothetical protein L3X38_037101 [Prunus dulcis]